MNWLNLAVLLIIVAGHAELCAAFINRLHGRPFQKKTLRRGREVHDLVVLLFPVVVLWRVGLGGPQLLTTGNWSDVPAGWLAYFALCGFGALSLTYSALRWLTRMTPRPLVSNHSSVVDIAQRLGQRPSSRGGLSGMLTKLPGNEVFRVEFSEKVLRLPRLPEEWSGLSILHLSDFHYVGSIDRPFFESVIEIAKESNPDLIVFTGDLLDDRKLLEWLPSTLGQLSAPLGCYFVLGNHDWYLKAPDETRRKFAECGWHDVAGNTTCINWQGHSLIIGGTERPWMGTDPNFAETDPHAFRLLLSHTPDNLPWAKQQKVDLMLAGHLHGGQIRLPCIGPVFAPSKYGCRYASGTFWEPPTLMHVSRGLAGKRALRFNCLPEVTRIVLEPVEQPVDKSVPRAQACKG